MFKIDPKSSPAMKPTERYISVKIDKDFSIVAASEYFLSLLGLDSQHTGIDFSNLFSQTSPSFEHWINTPYQLQTKPSSFETIFRRQDGTSVRLLWIANQVDESGDEEGFELTGCEQETISYEELFENANDFLVIIDPQGKLVSTNRVVELRLGYRREELLKMSITDILSSDDANKIMELMSVNNKTTLLEVDLLTRAKTKIPVEINASPTVGNGLRHGLYINARDISERVSTQKALTESEERYRAFMQQSSEAIWCIESEVPLSIKRPVKEQIDHFMKYSYLAECNDAMAKMYGLNKAEDINGIRLFQILPADDPHNIAYLTAFVHSDYKLMDVESHEMDKDGNLKYFLNNLVGIVEDGYISRVWGTQRDITLQRKTERHVRYMAGITENVSDAIASFDLDHKVVSWNKAAEESYGILAKEITGKKLDDFIDEYHYSGISKDKLFEVVLQEGFWKGEAYLKRYRTGEDVILLATISLLKNESDEPSGYIIVNKDITLRKQNESIIRESEQRFRYMADTAPVMIWISDEHDKTTYVNKAWIDFTGKSPDDFGSNGWETIVHPDDYAPVANEYNERFKEHVPTTFIYRLKTKSGGYRWILENAVPRFLGNGTFVGYIGSIVDIHDRKLAEERLSTYSQTITSILNGITDGFAALDKNFTITMWNPVAEQIVGISEEEIVGKNLMEAFEGYAQSSLFDNIRKAANEKTTVHFEQYIQQRDKWFEASVYPNRDGLFIYFKDVTARKKQEMILALEKNVLEINANPNATLKATVDVFLEGIEKIDLGMSCSVLLLEDDRLTIRHLSAPGLPKEYCDLIDGVAIGPKAGSCGTAMYTKKEVIVSDVATDPLWEDYKHLALRFGLAACWSKPIINGSNEVIGSFACYYHEIKSPSPYEIAIIDRTANLLRVIIENKRAEEKVRISNERYILATRATNEAIWDWDMRSNALYWGEGFYTLFGYKSGYKISSHTFWETHIHPDDKDRVTKCINDFIGRKEAGLWTDEYRFKKSDGNYAIVIDKGYIIYSKKGEMLRMVGAIEDVTERKQLEKRLFKQEIDKQKVVAQAVVDAQEKERAEMGKELHDNVNQILSTAKLFLEVAKNDPTERIALIKRSAESIHNAINEIRGISRSLVPPSISDLGLVDSINDLIESIVLTKAIKMRFNHSGNIEKAINDNQKLMLFRIIQEQVNNVLKHAEANNLTIDLHVHKAGIELLIIDDGKGFDIGDIKNKKGVGLSNITSRAELFNGKVNIETAPGKGCKLIVKTPIYNL